MGDFDFLTEMRYLGGNGLTDRKVSCLDVEKRRHEAAVWSETGSGS